MHVKQKGSVQKGSVQKGSVQKGSVQKGSVQKGFVPQEFCACGDQNVELVTLMSMGSFLHLILIYFNYFYV